MVGVGPQYPNVVFHLNSHKRNTLEIVSIFVEHLNSMEALRRSPFPRAQEHHGGGGSLWRLQGEEAWRRGCPRAAAQPHPHHTLIQERQELGERYNQTL